MDLDKIKFIYANLLKKCDTEISKYKQHINELKEPFQKKKKNIEEKIALEKQQFQILQETVKKMEENDLKHARHKYGKLDDEEKALKKKFQLFETKYKTHKFEDQLELANAELVVAKHKFTKATVKKRKRKINKIETEKTQHLNHLKKIKSEWNTIYYKWIHSEYPTKHNEKTYLMDETKEKSKECLSINNRIYELKKLLQDEIVKVKKEALKYQTIISKVKSTKKEISFMKCKISLLEQKTNFDLANTILKYFPSFVKRSLKKWFKSGFSDEDDDDEFN